MNSKTERRQVELDRRDFLGLSAATGFWAVVPGVLVSGCRMHLTRPRPLFRAAPMEKVRIGYVGVGDMGSAHVENLLKLEHAEICAVCDIVPEKVERVQQWVRDSGQPKPTGYTRGEYDFVRMCEKEDIDLVYTATPWRWHVPVCVAAMKNGKQAATEVPAAVTLGECWRLVETAEKYEKHCVMMENCCYDRIELMILNMVRQGILGELIHAECGYLHDLRDIKLTPVGEGLWRTAHSIKRNGDLYPTHGLGPVAQCMNINRGNQFDYLVSTGCNSRGLNLRAAKKYGPDSPQAEQTYALSDVVTTVIRTIHGQTILVKHDTSTPRPYSRDILVQGTKGVVRKYPTPKIYIEGITPHHRWEQVDKYLAQYEHPLWKALEERTQNTGHGGMDFIEDYRLIECLRKGEPTDQDVYDAAAWSAVSELSERSIAKGSQPVDFPDFTRGKWRSTPPLRILTG